MEPFDPYYPYFEFMYREANAWNCHGKQRRITKILAGSEEVDGWFVTHNQLRSCGTLTIVTE